MLHHADASLVPGSIKTKAQFWDHVYVQLESLLEGQRQWVTNLANASSLIFNSLLAFPEYFGSSNEKAVNWCGFYMESMIFPSSRYSSLVAGPVIDSYLLLGPFCGKPAWQFINTAPEKAKGVCADAYIQRKTLVVPDVDKYPGHIACDGESKSEIVVPLLLDFDGKTVVLGVLDLDCLSVGGFDEEDQAGLEKIAKLVVNACTW